MKKINNLLYTIAIFNRTNCLYQPEAVYATSSERILYFYELVQQNSKQKVLTTIKK